MLSISNGQALKGAALWLTSNELWWFGKKETEEKKAESMVYHHYMDHHICVRQAGCILLASCTCELDCFDSGYFSSSDCKDL